MRGIARCGGLVLLLALLGACGGEDVQSRGFGDYHFTDPARVYVGRHDFARRPAVVASDRVYQVIPEYQQILREGLQDTVPRYGFLMQKASERFRKAAKAAAKAAGCDVVAESGTVEIVHAGAAEPVDLTEATIAAVR